MLEFLLRLFKDVKAGVVVACSDMLMDLPSDVTPLWPQVWQLQHD